eukprot:8138454-Heterocapsa_arctica.AAC.1
MPRFRQNYLRHGRHLRMVAPPSPPPPGLDHPNEVKAASPDYFPPPGLDHPNEVKAAARSAKRKAFYMRMTAMEDEAAALQAEATALQQRATKVLNMASLLRAEWNFHERPRDAPAP